MDHGNHFSADDELQHMLITWDTINLCVVFRWWHDYGPWSLLFTLLGVIALGMSYEALRHLAHKFDESTGNICLTSPTHDDQSQMMIIDALESISPLSVTNPGLHNGDIS